MAPQDLAELYAEHAPGARRLAASLAPADQVDDLVAESFTRVIAAVNRGGRPERFRPYLMATVRNTARRRPAGRHRVVPCPDPEPPPAPGAGEEAERADEALRVMAALGALPGRWRAVLWATAVEDRKPAELAAAWGMTPGAVAQLAARAREGLRRTWLQSHVGQVPDGCRRHAALLGRATRGRLPRRDRVTLDAHLAGCAPCRELAAELAALNARLGVILTPAALALAARRLLRCLHHPAALASATVAAVTLAALPYVSPARSLPTPPARAAPQATAPALRAAAPPPAAARSTYQSRHRVARALPLAVVPACPTASPSATGTPSPAPSVSVTPGPAPSPTPSTGAPLSPSAPPSPAAGTSVQAAPPT